MPEEEITLEDIHKDLGISNKLRIVGIIQQQLLHEHYDMKNATEAAEYREFRLITRRIVMAAADHYDIEIPE